jgi:hypothetical protein
MQQPADLPDRQAFIPGTRSARGAVPQELDMNDAQSKLSRRRVFAGAGTVGALAAAAAVLPVGKQEDGAPRGEAKAEGSSGYRLTEHIQRYYQTTKI